MEAIEVFRAHLLRSDANQSWGFQLQGGAEVDQPLKISKVRIVVRPLHATHNIPSHRSRQRLRISLEDISSLF